MLAASCNSHRGGRLSKYWQPTTLRSTQNEAADGINLRRASMLWTPDPTETNDPCPEDSRRSTEFQHYKHGSCNVIVNGRPYTAVADNQASANVISLAFAVKECMLVESIRVPFILGNGTIRQSVGRAYAECALLSNPRSPRTYEFYVFPNVVEPLIVGRKFLHDTGLSKFPKSDRSLAVEDDDGADKRSIWTTRSLDHIEFCRWQVRAVLKYGRKSTRTTVLPDKGSDIDVMSLAYANRIGMEILPRRLGPRSIHGADGQAMEVLGFACASIQFDGRAGQRGDIAITFFLVEGAPFDVALGNFSVEQNRIFQDARDFDWICTRGEYADLCMLGWAQSRRARREARMAIAEVNVVVQSSDDTCEQVENLIAAKLEEAAEQASRMTSRIQTPARSFHASLTSVS